jgi:hypothetical protein
VPGCKLSVGGRPLELERNVSLVRVGGANEKVSVCVGAIISDTGEHEKGRNSPLLICVMFPDLVAKNMRRSLPQPAGSTQITDVRLATIGETKITELQR